MVRRGWDIHAVASDSEDAQIVGQTGSGDDAAPTPAPGQRDDGGMGQAVSGEKSVKSVTLLAPGSRQRAATMEEGSNRWKQLRKPFFEELATNALRSASAPFPNHDLSSGSVEPGLPRGRSLRKSTTFHDVGETSAVARSLSPIEPSRNPDGEVITYLRWQDRNGRQGNGLSEAQMRRHTDAEMLMLKDAEKIRANEACMPLLIHCFAQRQAHRQRTRTNSVEAAAEAAAEAERMASEAAAGSSSDASGSDNEGQEDDTKAAEDERELQEEGSPAHRAHTGGPLGLHGAVSRLAAQYPRRSRALTADGGPELGSQAPCPGAWRRRAATGGEEVVTHASSRKKVVFQANKFDYLYGEVQETLSGRLCFKPPKRANTVALGDLQRLCAEGIL